MNKAPPKAVANVVKLPVKPVNPVNTRESAMRPALAGSPDDPRMQEVMRLATAFLAIEDAAARIALVALAERLVSHDWYYRLHQV